MRNLGFLICAGAAAMAASAVAGDAKSMVQSAIADGTRLEEHKTRDADRKPKKVLSLAGIQPGDKVADLAAGSGYYTGLLSRLVGSQGQVYAVDPERIFESFPNARNTFPDYLAKDPRENVSYSAQKFDALVFDEPLDAIVMGLYYHDTVWTKVDRAAMNKAIFDALKPGGAYLVFDHLAVEGADESVTSELHRMIPGVTRGEIEAAGFAFAGETDALHNPEDARDRSVFADGVRGKTHRFVYLFRKPS